MRSRTFGPLGQRLFVAFLAVAMTSVLVLTGAALIGTSRGLNNAEARQRAHQAQIIASRLAAVYVIDGNGNGGFSSNPVRATEAADAFQVGFVVKYNNGSAWLDYGLRGNANGGMGSASMMGAWDSSGGRWTTVDLVFKGKTVGTVAVRFATPLESSAQTIAWSWILIAAVVSLLAAFLLAVLVSRRIARPLLRISSTAKRFAAGDRSARTDPRDAASRWELGDLARAFDATAADVVRSEEARRRISADVAHELRTPLAALQAGLEELRDGLVPPDPDRLAALHGQSVRLGRVVGDLAALSAAETAALSLQRVTVDLREIAADAITAAQPSLDAAGIHSALDAREPVLVQGDADRLHQALGNLLANVARYCHAGDSVTVTVSGADDVATVMVRDTGPGIRTEELPHVFDRLWRGSTASDIAGSGIGLAVVRELIAAHGGEVTAASDGTLGTTFTVRLPRV